jgi:hypothetical protein
MSSLVYNSIRNHLLQVEAEKWWTAILTGLFVFAGFLTLRFTTLPEPRFKTEAFAEIDFTKFIAPDRPLPKPKPLPSKAEKESNPEPQPTAPMLASQPELNVFEVLENPLVITPPPPESEPLSPENLSFARGKIDLARRTLDVIGNMEGPNVLQSAAVTPLQSRSALPNAIRLPEVRVATGWQLTDEMPATPHRPNHLPPNGVAGGTPQPKINISRGALRSNREAGPAHRPAITERPVVETVNQDNEKIAQKIDVKNFSNDLKKILNALFVKLKDWLKQRHKDLSPAVKHFMHYKPGDLTTSVLIDADGQVYELFIRCNEVSEEVAILMAEAGENGEAIYLRDVGFKQQSHYLGIGTIGRSAEGNVFTISMREETPTKEQTMRFYNIFLSWWDANNP